VAGFADPTKPSVGDYLLFVRGHVGIPVSALPDASIWLGTSFNVAMATVNDALNNANPTIYTLAVYNLGADRLINFAIDEQGQSYFTDLRRSMGLLSLASGLVSSSGDQGTNQSFEVIEAAKKMTINDIQLMRTPYGRAYLGFAQSYGPSIWGLT
jgi:hypothetical protein